MSDIDEIRKKHEEWKRRWPTENEYIFDNLTISDVDALFKALDEANGKVGKVTLWVDEHERFFTDDWAVREIRKLLKG